MASARKILIRLRNRYRRTLSERFGCRIAHLRNTVPLISFRFDDFPGSAPHTGGAILKRYGAMGTYYTALVLMDKDSPVGRICGPDELQQLIREGHELGCHTFAHC